MARTEYSTEKLEEHLISIINNDVEGAIDVYSKMYNNGYKYAGWALGVAENDTITGKSATDFLVKTAQQGVGGIAPKTLTTSKL